MKRFIVCIAALSFVLSGLAQKGEKSGKKQRVERETKRIEQVRTFLESKKYVFKATHAIPMGGSSIYLNSSNDLKIEGDSAFAYLPYYGIAYYAEYGGGNGGIEFEEPISDYSVKPSKFGKQINFKVKAPKDTYHFMLSVSESGYSNLNVTCNNRQSIQFYGMIEDIKKE